MTIIVYVEVAADAAAGGDAGGDEEEGACGTVAVAMCVVHVRVAYLPSQCMRHSSQCMWCMCVLHLCSGMCALACACGTVAFAMRMVHVRVVHVLFAYVLRCMCV